MIELSSYRLWMVMAFVVITFFFLLRDGCERRGFIDGCKSGLQRRDVCLVCVVRNYHGFGLQVALKVFYALLVSDILVNLVYTTLTMYIHIKRHNLFVRLGKSAKCAQGAKRYNKQIFFHSHVI